MGSRFAGDAESLLDLACGRGGDIWKWIDAGIKYVKGIDLSPGEIEEAKTRFLEASEKRKCLGTVCEFMASHTLGLDEHKEGRQYDAVTCMFALHYFFVTEQALKQFLHNVSINLKPGGYFFGTVPDGKAVNECVKKNAKFASPMLMIEARWQGQPETFGSPYICAIGDTVTSGEQGTEGSLEYLVYQNVLIGVAKLYDLEPVYDYQDPALESCLRSEDKDRLMKHFAPCFPESDPSLETASALFTTFVFRKKNGKQENIPSETRDAVGASAPVKRKLDKESDADASAKKFKRPVLSRKQRPPENHK